MQASCDLGYDDARARLGALFAPYPDQPTLSPDDIDDEASTVFSHQPAVLIAFEKTSHIVPTPARRSDPSIPEGLVRWRSDFEEERDRVMVERAEAKRKRKANKAKKLLEAQEARKLALAQGLEIVQAKPIPQKTINFMNRLAEQNERVQDRILHGDHFAGGMMADRYYGEIHEFFGVGKYRSSLNPSLARINQLLPRAASGRAQSGRTKREVISHLMTESSLLLRDNAYIVADPRRLGILVVELDSTWLKYNDLIAALRAVLPKKLMPALIVSRKSWCGKYEVEKPHLLWPLPCEVGKNGNSRAAPVKFFERVQRALINALIPLGADPNHFNTGKFKNPLSMFWNVLCLNGEWPSLEDFRGKGGINLNTSEAAMRQKAMLYRATTPGQSLSLSNEVWIAGKEMIKAVQAAAHAMMDPEYQMSRKDEHHRRCWLRNQITRPMLDRFGDTDQVRKVIDEHCDWWARHRDKADIDFGRDASRIYREGMDAKQELTEEERQHIAAEETNKGQRNEFVHAVAGAIVKFRQTVGCHPTPPQVISSCKDSKSVGKSTVYKYWDEAVIIAEQIFRDATRYIAIPHPVLPKDPVLASCQQPDGSPEPVQPSGPPDSGIVQRPILLFRPPPTSCGPPDLTDDIELDLDDARPVPVTAEACSRPRSTLH